MQEIKTVTVLVDIWYAKVNLGHKAGIEKFDGYTEAWTKKSLNVTSIKQILDWVYEDEAVPENLVKGKMK